MLSDLVVRIRSLFRRASVEAEMNDELRFHIERQTEKLAAAGIPREEAARRAHLEFGGVEQVKEECRDARGTSLVESLLQDVRYALRILRKNPGFTAVSMLTLALGIGANTAMFSIVYAVLVRPLPYAHPQRLTMVWQKDDLGRPGNTSFATYTDWKTRNHSFEQLALFRSWQPVLSGRGDPQKLIGLRVSNNFFRTLGVRPELGRDLRPEEDQPSTSHVVLLSHGLWERQFGSDPAIAGKTITLNAASYLVAGVLPADFESLLRTDPAGGPPEIFGALGYDASLPWACRTCQHLQAIGRVRFGVSFAQAQAEMDAISAALWKEHPSEYSASGVIFTPLREHLLGPLSRMLYVLLGAVSFVLLIACVNLANLLLARAAHREREMAVRATLGAGRLRMVRQLIVENWLLATAGAAAGLLPAWWTPRVLSAIGAGGLPRLADVRLDWHVLLFAFLAALLTGLVSGIVPALRLSKLALHDSLRERVEGSSGAAHRRLRGLFVVTEIALSLTLLVGAGLLLRSLSRLLEVAPGFDPQNVLTLIISTSGPRYDQNAALRQFYTDVLQRAAALPGVKAVGMTSEVPLGGNMDQYGFHAEGKMNANPELDPSAERYCVSPGYRRAMRIPLLRGRDLAPSDAEGAPLALLINQATAREIWPGEDPLGKRVKLGGTDKPWWTVVGIVGDVHQGALDARPNMQFYVPHAQWPYPDSDMVLAIRTSGPAAGMISAIRQVIHSVDPNQPVSRIMTLQEYIGASVGSRRLVLILLNIFAGIAVSLAIVGIYGVASYTVAQRTHEIGIRMALGAQRHAVLGMLLGQGLALALAGIGIGIAASFELTRFLGSLLFGVTPTDPATFAVVSLLLAGAALAAFYLPARRAMRVDPLVALRYE
ncbi:MAG TPA: ABC transporter permease [Candidatus Acidoferrales bacterium]|nr:ABC transporter permease [Candidatus Acidoferrales bacterium]